MNSEFLPATAAMQQELVLLHGWGCNREIWRPLLHSMRPWANITLMELPGCAPAAPAPLPPELDSVLTAILAIAPASAVYVGWSLITSWAGSGLSLHLTPRSAERDMPPFRCACTEGSFKDGGYSTTKTETALSKPFKSHFVPLSLAILAIALNSSEHTVLASRMLA